MDAAPDLLLESDAAATRVLVLEPDDALRTAFRRILVQEKLDVQVAASWPEALESVTAAPPGCVLLALDTLIAEPGAVSRLTAGDDDRSVVVLAGEADRNRARQLIGDVGEVLVRPVDLQELVAAVRHALRARDARITSHQVGARLQEEVALRTAELQQERRNLQRLSVATLESLVNALEAKDPHLRGHSARVAELAARVAAACGLGADDIETVRTAGRLHDIGKIGIREALLHKAGPLTDEEFAHVRTHAELGARILAPLTHLGDVILFVRHHHERWDGTGYPDGLRSEVIPLGARIIGAVEIYDALTTSRPYQGTMNAEAAVLRLRELSGTVVDPRVAEALATVVLAGGA